MFNFSRSGSARLGALLVTAGAAALPLSLLASCNGNRTQPTVTLYTSADGPVADMALEAFERETGIKVLVVGDTEATKTTGLVQRLVSEKDAPKADVWWSNEMLGTAQLASMGLFMPFKPDAAADFTGRQWPSELCDPTGLWHGHALRYRVIAFNTTLVPAASKPRSLQDLCDPRFKGRIGMARPQFGTTRTQIAALVALHGAPAVRTWLTALRDNGLRLFDGNSSVVQALAHGEIAVGLTDSDDALGAAAKNWPVAFGTEEQAAAGGASSNAQGLKPSGLIVIPNTVAIIKNAPHMTEARVLAQFLLSSRCEALLGATDAKTVSVRGSASASLGARADIQAAQLLEALSESDALVNELLPVH
ncbi:MAG: extracellular solute-binding protein [Planctomycetota bacterium]|nr:extracellular solute-binding protein [Planctomycetota bacterium]